MSFSDRITRTPRAHDADRADEARAAIDGIDAASADVVAGAAGSSPYLAGLIAKEAAWLPEALSDPEAALDALIADPVGDGDPRPALRRAKRRAALLIGLCDLAGVWPLSDVIANWTRFADAVTDAALKAALAPLIKRGKLPGQTLDDLDSAGGMVVFAMGKMGAYELNYSSDIDLICLFDETRFDADDFHEARATFVKATRTMAATLSEMTGDGYVFRTDLRLRPDPSVTPVCMAMEAAERYYESLGRTWERAAYIKARPCAGDLKAGERFIKNLRPFIWRRHLDFAAIQDAHDMRLAIREHKGLGGPITLPDHNMKLGRGGIREIEFFTQTRQIIAGGRDPDLRVRGTLDGLKVLAEKDWVPEDTAKTLSDHYIAHRTVENRLQQINDAQTHSLPKSDEGFARLAALMDREVDELREELHARLSEVHEIIEGFFSPDASQPEDTGPQQIDEERLARWHGFPAFRSERARQVFKRLRPELEARLTDAARPDEALLALDGFLEGLPAGVQIFTLFEANPKLIDLLLDIVGTAPALAEHLSRNSSIFDAVIGGDFFADWPGPDALERDLNETLAREPDYEARLDTARRWAREWHFRVGVHLLRGLVDASEAGTQYADLAQAVLRALWPVVVEEFARKHGPPPGRGACMLGMGSLGAGRLNATSDLDMIMIYDAQGVEASEGKRPLQTRTYYARLTQAMITAVSARMANGRLYEVDMRLRPSGTQGPVATSLDAFRNYQQGEAWTWEHLALTRARVIAGDDGLAEDIEAFRHDLIDAQDDAARIAGDVSKMRSRIREAKTPKHAFDAKIGAGRMQDIELFAQAALLVSGTRSGAIDAGLSAARDLGWIDDKALETLQSSYRDVWGLQTASRLIHHEALDPDQLGQGGREFLLRCADLDGDAEAALIARYKDAADIIDAALEALS